MPGLMDLKMDQTTISLSLTIGLMGKRPDCSQENLEKQLEVVSIESDLKKLLNRYLMLECSSQEAAHKTEDILSALSRISISEEPLINSI